MFVKAFAQTGLRPRKRLWFSGEAARAWRWSPPDKCTIAQVNNSSRRFAARCPHRVFRQERTTPQPGRGVPNPAIPQKPTPSEKSERIAAPIFQATLSLFSTGAGPYGLGWTLDRKRLVTTYLPSYPAGGIGGGAEARGWCR